MDARNGWLFPLMVLAAGSVMAFGCIGIALITGDLDEDPLLDQPIPYTAALESTGAPTARAEAVAAVGVSATSLMELPTDTLVAPRKRSAPLRVN